MFKYHFTSLYYLYFLFLFVCICVKVFYTCAIFICKDNCEKDKLISLAAYIFNTWGNEEDLKSLIFNPNDENEDKMVRLTKC